MNIVGDGLVHAVGAEQREGGRPMTLAEIADDETVTHLRTDAVIAQELRDEVAPHLAAICRAMDKARTAGLVLNFNIAPDQYGRFRAPEVSIVKPL